MFDKIEVASRGARVVVDPSKFSQEIIANLFAYGVKQKLADAASGAAKLLQDEGLAKDDPGYDAKVEAQTLVMMEKALDALLAGEWSTRQAAEGISEYQREARIIMRRIVKEKYGAKSAKWKDFIGLSDADQNAKLDELFAANEAKLASAVNDEIARKRAAREAKQSLAVDINL